ncbi:MAG: type II secretion system protein GspN [Desulfohalobiaceae bacterium]|nr:type II secretion system protein GspN [Desulfohalobiaceae bacterium]
MKRFFKILGYVMFGIFVGTALIVYRFPYDTLAKRIEAESSQRLGCELSIEELGYRFPLSLAFSRMSIESKDLGLAAPIVVNSGQIKAGLLALVSWKLGTGFSGTLFSGEVQGSLVLDSLLGPESYALDFQLQDIDLGELKLSEKIAVLSSLQGSLSGVWQLQGSLRNVMETSGSGKMAINQGSLELAPPGIKGIQLRELEGEGDFALEKRKLDIEQIAFSGRGVKGKAQGRASFENPLDQTRLELEGTIDFTSEAPQLYSLVRESMKQTSFQFVMQGPLQRLEYRLP